MKALLGYPRVLDLTDNKGFLCGKLLGDLGADVLKVERPGGDRSRYIAPFCQDVPDAEHSLYWFAFNSSKRGITLDIETACGRDILKRLVERADMLVESFAPGYLEKLGLGYEALSRINEGLIMTSITPFGQTGPYKDYEATDITLMAMGGMMSLMGDVDRPPLRLPLDQAYYLAGAWGAAATLMAYHQRQSSGRGQHADVSIYECVVNLNYAAPVQWEVQRRLQQRMSSRLVRAKHSNRVIWPCKDGYVTWIMIGGRVGARDNRTLVQWMAEEDAAGRLTQVDWEALDMSKVPQEEIESLEEPVARFFANRGKEELQTEATRRGVRLFPVYDIDDLLRHEQLAARQYWLGMEHPSLADGVPYPGQWYLSDETDSRPTRRPPLVGEHNQEIYEGELGFSREELAALERAGVI